MGTSPTPEERAKALVTVMSRVPGGSWLVRLGEDVFLGPYENPAVAREDAERVARFVAAVIREVRPAP